ncbi:MAG: DUF1127 domain-containing protein [Pseudomonadota bacterium]
MKLTSLNQLGTMGTRVALPRPRGPSLPLRLWHAFLGRYRARRDYRNLLDMPDHMLRDVGLERFQVRAEMQRMESDVFWWFKP